MNVKFVRFIFKYARSASHTKKQMLDSLKEEDANLFAYVTPSDIAWTLLVFFNNLQKWEADILKEKKKAVRNNDGDGGIAGPGQRKRTRKANSCNMRDGTTTTGETTVNVRQQWSGKKRNASGGDGYSDEGKKFYHKLCHIFYNVIGVDEWKELWAEFWEEERTKHIKPEALNSKPKWNTHNEGEKESGGCDLFDMAEDYAAVDDFDGMILPI